MKVTLEFQKTSATTDDSRSPAPVAGISAPILSSEAHESVLTTRESKQVVYEMSSQSAHAEHMVHSNSLIESLPPRGPPTTVGKLSPAVKGKKHKRNTERRAACT